MFFKVCEVREVERDFVDAEQRRIDEAQFAVCLLYQSVDPRAELPLLEL